MKQGRPREFDTETALDKAQELFCELGYEGASLSKLTKAMGISSPSLYSAFGDKEHLFLAVLDRYVDQFYLKSREVLFAEGVSTLESFIGYVEMFIDAHRKSEDKQGCLVANSSIYIGNHFVKIEEKLKAAQLKSQALFCERLELGLENGDVSGDVDAKKFALFLSSIFQGVALQVRCQEDFEVIDGLGEYVVGYLRGVLG